MTVRIPKPFMTTFTAYTALVEPRVVNGLCRDTVDDIFPALP